MKVGDIVKHDNGEVGCIVKIWKDKCGRINQCSLWHLSCIKREDEFLVKFDDNVVWIKKSHISLVEAI